MADISLSPHQALHPAGLLTSSIRENCLSAHLAAMRDGSHSAQLGQQAPMALQGM